VSQIRSPRLLALGVLAAAALAAPLGLPGASVVAPASAAPSGVAATAVAPVVDPASPSATDPRTPAVASVEEEHGALKPETAAATIGAKTVTGPRNVPCTTPGTSGNRVQAVYVHYGSSANRIGSLRPYIVDALLRANNIVYYSARQTGGYRQLRLATGSDCKPSVAVVNLPASAASSFSGTVSALSSKGYTSTARKYVVFADARVICGLGQTYNDDQAGRLNRNNRGPQFARVDLGCWSGIAVAHEIFHTLGAVQKSAPRTNTSLHCRDERDVMCYAGAGGTSVYVSSYCSAVLNDERLDCNKNDYFHTNPKAGTYLATRWNTARSSFLWGGGPSYR
jgi:hypothetical protein